MSPTNVVTNKTVALIAEDGHSRPVIPASVRSR